MVLSMPGWTSNGRTAGVGNRLRNPKCAVSPAMVGSPRGVRSCGSAAASAIHHRFVTDWLPRSGREVPTSGHVAWLGSRPEGTRQLGRLLDPVGHLSLAEFVAFADVHVARIRRLLSYATLAYPLNAGPCPHRRIVTAGAARRLRDDDVLEPTNPIVWRIRHPGQYRAGDGFPGAARRCRSPSDGRGG